MKIKPRDCVEVVQVGNNELTMRDVSFNLMSLLIHIELFCLMTYKKILGSFSYMGGAADFFLK